MPTILNQHGYKMLIDGDIEWLLANTEDSLERQHIIQVLNWTHEHWIEFRDLSKATKRNA